MVRHVSSDSNSQWQELLQNKNMVNGANGEPATVKDGGKGVMWMDGGESTPTIDGGGGSIRPSSHMSSESSISINDYDPRAGNSM